VNTQVIWHPLAHIIDIQVEAIGWNPDRNANCQIALFLKSGDRIHHNPNISQRDRRLCDGIGG
jgi:hypothetical protein